MNKPITIVVSLLIAFVLGVVLIYPKYQDMVIIRSQVKARENELRSRQEYLVNLAQVSEKLKEYEEQLGIIDSALPLGPSLPLFFDYLQKTASQNGLILTGMTHSPTGSGEGIKTTSVSLTVTGSYSSFKEFIGVLEKSSRMIEIGAFSFSAPEDEIYDFNLSIRVHSY
jgi:Tfp pilus assembly protein PilO